MYSDLNAHKKSDAIKWVIAFSLIFILLLGMSASIYLGVINMQKDEEVVEGEQDETIVNDFDETNITNSEMLSLNLLGDAAYATADDGTTSVSKTITATVYPTTATNTKVNWSVEWGGSQTGTVTDYVTVTPSSSGSTTATVTCYKAFSGEIVIVCTTQEGGYSATCTVSFVGYPTDINVTGGSIAVSNNTLDLGIGSTYTYNVSLSNVFNNVGSQFNNISASVTGVGTITVGYYEYYRSGTSTWYDGCYSDVDIDTIKDKFITVSYSSGTLTIQTLQSIESYYKSRQLMDGGRTIGYTDKYYATVSDCYFNVTITEATSGISKTIKVNFDKGVVTSVTLSNTEIAF